ncbi:MAG: 30S ribosomal protein S6e [Nitrososphaerales archaeon]
MPAFKLVISDPKSGKSISRELKDQLAQPLLGLKIGDIFDAEVIGIPGKIKITGGSDKAGFPMRADVLGGVKKYALISKGTGLRKVSKGERRRKLVRGNTITDEIYQINAVLVEGKLVKEEAQQPAK